MTSLEFFGSVGVVFVTQAVTEGIRAGLRLFPTPSKGGEDQGTEDLKFGFSYVVVHILALVAGAILFMIAGGNFEEVGTPLTRGNLVLLYILTAISAVVLSVVRAGLSVLLRTLEGWINVVGRLFLFAVGVPSLGRAWFELSWRGASSYISPASLLDQVLTWVILIFGLCWILLSFLPLRALPLRLRRPRFAPLVLLVPLLVHVGTFFFFFYKVFCGESWSEFRYYVAMFIVSVVVMIGGFLLSNLIQAYVMTRSARQVALPSEDRDRE